MDTFEKELSAILIEVYYNILKLEEMALMKSGSIPLTINEMHMIESVGKGSEELGRTVSELADDLGVTRPSATVAVNKLEKKGFLKKNGCESDGRLVRVTLTAEGERVNNYHSYYHRGMVRKISRSMSREEKGYLLIAVRKLNEFFKNSMGEIE